jgi:hypothetical protein
MKAKAWVRNPDPRPRGLVFRLGGSGLTPWWGGVVTSLEPGWDLRAPMPGVATVIGDTREEALAKLEPVLEEARLRHG